jgi:ferredoxin
MAQSKIPSARKKKIKALLSKMNKQNKRFLPVGPQLAEMINLMTTDEELDYLIKMGTGLYDYKQAKNESSMSEKQFESFFDTMRRKGLVHSEHINGKERFRLNAIAVGWYEVASHYLVGKPQEKEFAAKWQEFFKFFQKLTFDPLLPVQNLVMRSLVKPTQGAAIMDPATKGKSKRKTIPINTEVSPPDSNIYPTYHVSELIEEFGSKNAIGVFPCVCRHQNQILGSPCDYEMPKESCIVFGRVADEFAEWGYGRKVSKDEAIEILKDVREKGAVHTVIHERDDHQLPVVAICNCCWDCCGILKPYNMGAVALKYESSFIARIKEDADCKGCGNCEKYCPTTAIKMKDKKVSLNSDLCIGCGQCAFQCKQNNIELHPNERVVYLPVLKKSEARLSA